MKEKLYLILDNQGSPLAQATLESPPGAEVAQMRLVQEMDMDFTLMGELQFIGLDDSLVSKRGTVTIQRGDRLAVRTGAILSAEARQNLRIKTDFESVMYPVTGNWKGQRPIRGHDLSCGGVAFHSERELQPREIVQIVLPVTDEPMVLKTRILRPIPTDEPVPLYASQFVDLILDEEIMIRKAVFSIQVGHPRPAVNS